MKLFGDANTRSRSAHWLRLALLTSVWSAIPHFASAADAAAAAASTNTVEDVVVTARKREERLIDVPMAVTSLSSARLEASNIQNATDLIARVPGLYFAQANTSAQSSDFTSLTLRGVGFNAGLEPAVGVYVDGVYQPNLGFNLGFLDAERIEVLRGPQGTLFGRNTEGGALNIVTRKPGNQVGGNALLDVGNFSTVRARGNVSGPLSDVVSAGISGEIYHTDGYLKNSTLNRDQSPSTEYSVRPVVLFKPTDKLEFTLAGDYFHRRYNATDLGVPLDCHCYTELNENFQRDSLSVGGVSLNGKWSLDGVTLTSITAGRWTTSDIHLDNDGVASSRVPFINFQGLSVTGTNWNMNAKQHDYSQEFRAESDNDGPITWLAGVYFFKEQYQQSRYSYYADVSTFTPAFQTALKGGTINEHIVLDRKGYAGFGQASYKFGQFELTGGLRYGHESVDIGGRRTRSLPPPSALLDFVPHGDVSFDNWSPMASLSYAPAENTRLYATVSRGWKAGGFPKFISTQANLIPYKSENSTNYEIGWKGAYLDNRATLTAALFYVDIKNQQLTSLTKIDGLNVSTTTNAGHSRSKGAELEATIRPITGLSLSTSLSYTDTNFIRFIDQNNFDHAGTTFPFIPKVTAQVAADYTRPIGGEWNAVAHAEYRYVDSTRVENINKPASYLPIPSYDRVDASLGAENARYKVLVYVQNLFDTYDITNIGANGFSSVTAGPYFAQVMAPRTYGVRATVNF